ncbi:ghrelin/obestatin prepropeptide [Trichomycterus rosablanca]|uniref:ghrelin/obestatin prepropeptide n=1 Tax=Trichomycterus rosablanca TaxID=2290929 RepID=UPI002F3538E9
MLCNSRLSRGILLICTLSLWAECIMCGSSFLSPTQKPQSRGDRKPARVGRRAAAEQEPPLLSEDKVMVSAPFQFSVSLSEDKYKEYGPVLQRMLLDILDDVPFLE